MKKLLSMFLALLVVVPAVAQELSTSAVPMISITESRYEYSIEVVGNGVLTVELYREGIDGYGENLELFESAQASGDYHYVIPRPYDISESFRCVVKATAQEENMMPSEEVTSSFEVRGFFLMPTPEIFFNEEEDGLYINVEGQGQLSVNVTINDVSFDVDQLPYFVPRTYEDQVICVNAVADGYGNLDVLPAGVTQSYLLAAIPVPPDPVIVPKPFIWVEEETDYVIIHADPASDPEGIYGEMAVYLYIDGQEVENPYVVMRTSEVQDLGVSAYAVSLNNPEAQPSETAVYVCIVEPLPIPVIEDTAAPILNGYTVENDGYAVAIYETEPSTIYYRQGIYNEEEMSFDFGDWMLYESPIAFYEPGNYRVEAYSIAEGKNQSVSVAYEFVLTKPTPSYIYDFEEDGIYYKITAGGKVSVCSETTAFNSYSGKVTIPATVTHEGVTYMVSGIQENAFRACADLTEVTIGAYVTAIGNRAFKDCVSLTSVTLGDYVITLGSEAFSGCSSLSSVTLGSGLASIGTNAFQGCDALTSVTCKAATPPVMAASNCFACYSTATLHVHPAVLDSYRATNYWNQFADVVAEDRVAPAAGDTNGDGRLSIGDVTTLIDMLLRQ